MGKRLESRGQGRDILDEGRKGDLGQGGKGTEDKELRQWAKLRLTGSGH